MYCYDHGQLVCVAQLLRAFALLKAILSFVLSFRPSTWIKSTPTGRFFFKFNVCVFFENISRKFKFYYNPIEMTGILHEDQSTFLTIFAQFILE
jgi:hypothetical protein